MKIFNTISFECPTNLKLDARFPIRYFTDIIFFELKYNITEKYFVEEDYYFIKKLYFYE